jgi:hypothetical protein
MTSPCVTARMLLWLCLAMFGVLPQVAGEEFRLAPFQADVTIPLGHRCMGVLPTKAQRIVDPLDVHGFVLIGADQPIVLAAVDWCEIRNGAYDQWREVLARAAGTTVERVLVASLHQHDAPVVDHDAQLLLDGVGLPGELYDPQFHAQCLEQVAAAVRAALNNPRRCTHIGIGQARVEQVASNRRVVREDGQVTYERGSRSGGDRFLSEAPDGTIDPFLKTISFWDEQTPLLALHAYATHPMSYYGNGDVSADFVGMARRRRQLDDPQIAQIYVSGCSGDVTAGKYNDGSPAMRGVLADRLYQAMCAAWEKTRREPLENLRFSLATLDLPYHDSEALRRPHLEQNLGDAQADVRQRILAAMALSSRDRVDRGQAIDVPCIDFGKAQIVLLPGESFVSYQLMAQQIRPDSFVVTIGYGECWPGYVPTESAFDDGFHDVWLWVGRGCEPRIRGALERLLLPAKTSP